MEHIDEIFFQQLSIIQRDGVDLLRAFFADFGQQDDDTLPSLGIGRIVNETHQRDEIAHVLALEEFYSARDLVGHACFGKRELHFERQKVGSI